MIVCLSSSDADISGLSTVFAKCYKDTSVSQRFVTKILQ
jgi:hypothetical protein